MNSGEPNEIPSAPGELESLDLMRRLEQYGRGKATWKPRTSKGKVALSDREKKACLRLYENLKTVCEDILKYILDRVQAREMAIFTSHDHTHGLKVAHLMWYLLTPERRERLTPPEIGLLIGAAYLHDVGMALTDEERESRYAPESDLWLRLEADFDRKQEVLALQLQVGDMGRSQEERNRATLRLQQALEAILCLDTRDRHATPERYEEVTNWTVTDSTIALICQGL